ncbi:MAG: hypothetical protein CVU89_14095 [Firmicutes bacterium HGW-Firmicutes-14]|nr:MAG: hypothetical protein CVU89_14095 [Firmicutes bacterium HGW-Firmicutes-14]
MEKALELLITKAHPAVINFLVIVIGVLVLIWIYSAIKTLKVNVTAYETASKLIELQNKYNELKNKSDDLGKKYNQSRVILAGIKSTFTETSYLMSLLASGQDIKGLGDDLLRSITDRISADLKYSAGEIHRCAVWFPINNVTLGMVAASSGYADHYRNQRTLPIDGSIAGRCYRTKKSIYSSNINLDRDFKSNSSQTPYNSLICVPLVFGNSCLGIITVDGKEVHAFVEEDVEAVETYGKIVTLIRMMQIVSASSAEAWKEVAPDDQTES